MHAANSRLQELALSLSLKCLSFDFVGTSIDESSEEFGTVQVCIWRYKLDSSCFGKSRNLLTWPWKLLLLLKITNMFYSYNSLSCMFITSGMFFISFILLTEFNSTDSIFLETCLRGFFNITDIFWLLCAHKAPHLQRG